MKDPLEVFILGAFFGAFLSGVLFSLLIQPKTEFATKKRVEPTMQIKIENGMSDTTYFYKFLEEYEK